MGSIFDLKGSNITNGEPYYDGLYGDRDLVCKKYVDLQDAKQDIAINDTDKRWDKTSFQKNDKTSGQDYQMGLKGIDSRHEQQLATAGASL